jgi:hypothetical protein
MYLVDNLIVNGDYGDFDSYMRDNETEEEFIERIKDKVLFYSEKERFVCYSLYVI